MNEYMVYFWIGMIIVTAVIEALTAGLTSLWVTGGAVVALVLALVKLPTWLQFLAFAAVSVALLAFTRPLFVNSLKKGIEKTNVDSVPGSEGVVTEAIKPIDGTGLVKVKGALWSAKSFDDKTEIGEGVRVTVIAVEGVKVVVKPAASSLPEQFNA